MEPASPTDATSTAWRIDDLAREAKVTTRNIRAFAARGLLPPPQLKGRTGYYGPEHLTRLQRIATLQERGYSLNSIGELLTAWDSGRQIPELLGLQTTLTRSWVGEQRTVDLAELTEIAPQLVANPAMVERAIELQVLARDGARFRLLNEPLLQAGRELVDLGLPLSDVFDTLVLLRGVIGALADSFVDLFIRHLWGSVQAQTASGKAAPELIANLDRLRPLANQVVGAVLAQSMDRAISQAVSGHGEPTP